MQTRSKAIYNVFMLVALLASLADSPMTYTSARAIGILFAKHMATGSGTCFSWANACPLKKAIDLSIFGDEIWVQAGTHVPE